MRRLLVGSVALAVIAFVPLVVTAQQKGKDGKTTQATQQDYALLAGRYSQIDAKFVSGDATKIVVSIEHPHAVKNTNTNTNNAASRTRRTTGGGVTVQHDHIEFELPIRDKAVVKKNANVGGGGFDDKGTPKTASTDAAKKAPGGGTLVDVADIAAGSVIRLQLDSPKKPATAKDADGDIDARSSVRSVTVLSEPGSGAAAADNGKKKKT